MIYLINEAYDDENVDQSFKNDEKKDNSRFYFRTPPKFSEKNWDASEILLHLKNNF